MNGPPPLQQHLFQMTQQVLQEREQAWQQVLQSYKLTLSLLQDIQKGVVDVQQVYVTDDGWQLLPPEPED